MHNYIFLKVDNKEAADVLVKYLSKQSSRSKKRERKFWYYYGAAAALVSLWLINCLDKKIEEKENTSKGE